MRESIQTNGAVPVPVAANETTAPPAAQVTRRHYLTEAQRQFFVRQKQTMTNIEMGMRGALQMAVEERGIAGKVTLSEDCAELIVEAE